jgi:hypothetical protein
MARRKSQLWGRCLTEDGTVFFEWHPDTGEKYINEEVRDRVKATYLERISETASDMVNSGQGLSLLDAATCD